ncbi:hypothetical protein CHUAL_000099 [Chamberlinius hualienensis]
MDFTNHSNSSNSSSEMLDPNDEFIPYKERIETYVVPILFAIIFIVGILGNGTLILIFTRIKSLRNIPNTYIINLAIGDILVLVISLPFTSTIYTIESWPYGEFICKFSEFIKDVSIGVSVFTLTALSGDRFFAIMSPMRRYMGEHEALVTIIVVTCIWVLSICLALPTAILAYVRTIDEYGFKVCWPYPEYIWNKYPQFNVISKFLVYYLIPLLTISCFYVAMACHLYISSKNVPGEVHSQTTKQVEARKKVAKAVTSFVVIFAICFFPTHVFMIWFYFYPYAQRDFDDFWNATRITGFCLTFINSCINPIALYCISGAFRKYYNKYLFCCFIRRGFRQRTKSETERQGTLVNFQSTFRRTSTTVSMLQSALV